MTSGPASPRVNAGDMVIHRKMARPAALEHPVLAFKVQVVLESRKQLREGVLRARKSDSAESLAYVLTMSFLFVTWNAMATAKFWLGIGILCAGILVLATVSI